MEMKIDGEWMVSPPHYAIWIPPGMAHYSRNRSQLAYRSAYLSAALSRRLPTRCSALEVSPLLRELLHELARQGVTDPQTPVQRRMAAVVIDQIVNAAVLPSFLPIASSDALKQVMAYMEKHLSAAESVAEIARRHHMSVRKLERLARSELGMSLGDWRAGEVRARHRGAVYTPADQPDRRRAGLFRRQRLRRDVQAARAVHAGSVQEAASGGVSAA